MIRHVVMWKLQRPEEAPRFKELLDTCRGIVPGLVGFETAIRADCLEATCDVILITTFTDAQSLAEYQTHPAHKAVSGELGAMRESRWAFDFTVGGAVDGSATAAEATVPRDH